MCNRLPLLLLVAAAAFILVAAPAAKAASTQQTNDNAAASAYCLSKYPIQGNASAPAGQDPVDANFSNRTVCTEWYAKELNARYAGGSKPTTNQCKPLGTQVGVCTGAISAASHVSKPGTPAPPHIAPTPTAPSGCTGTCINADQVGIPKVYVGSGLKTVVDILSFIAAILSVIFIILGGIRYSTSEGNSQNITSAKQTITFAIIGLVLSILAPLIVGFAIGSGPQ